MLKLNYPYKIYEFEELSSTNDTAKKLILEEKQNLIVTAKRQTGGKGRKGRSFNSPDGGLYISFGLKLNLDINDLVKITTYAAVCVLNAIETLSGANCEIKWVNDIRINGRKVCGILAENIYSVKTKENYTVLGIGVNVLGTEFPDSLKDIATSIEKETGKKILISDLASEIANNLKDYDFSDYMDEYRAKSCVISKTVTVISPNGSYEAKAVGITDDGKLKVEHSGKSEILFSGDVSIKI